jgi:hypothetical protein
MGQLQATKRPVYEVRPRVSVGGRSRDAALAAVTVPHTATATTLRFFDVSPGVNEVHEYTRQ